MGVFEHPVKCFCVICFLSAFAASGAVASDAAPAGKPAQARPGNENMKLTELVQRLEAGLSVLT